MDRRDFLAHVGMAAAWAAIPVTISACSSDDENNTTGGTTAPPTTPEDVTGVVSVSAGHSHSGAVVTDVQLSSGNAVDLTLTGSGHTHSVSLTAADITNIEAGNTVSVVSSSSGHTHTVTFN